ncbi:TOMM precursor leader peptide-binding protein [Actinacidiphila alni]|uniref:TOMM precursor leader peptide-binding protein n=1 Tax=Actinacidiphila alni TaxID=380248 RepID=UPI0034547E88
MVSPYDEIADTRPRIRRDVLYTQTPTGVHFHNARGGFSVVMPSAYRFATLIVPHLTGDHTVAALCQGLGDKQREMVVRLVSTLYARGFARDAVPPAADAEPLAPAVADRFAAQIDYVDHYTDGAADRFGRFRRTRVAVLGDDALARWAVLGLIRNGCAAVAVPRSVDTPGNRFGEVLDEAAELRAGGCPTEVKLLEAAPDAEAASGGYGWDQLDGYDLVLVTGEHAPRQTARLLDAGLPAGRLLLPAWTFGESVVIGPLTAPDTAGCWTCAVLRLGANGPAGAAADLWSTVAPAGPADSAAPTVGGPLAAMIGNLLAYEVFRRTTGVLPAETENQLLVQDIDSLDTTAEPLLPHPRCPRCGAAPEAADAQPLPELASLDDALAATAADTAIGVPEAVRSAAPAGAAAGVAAGTAPEAVTDTSAGATADTAIGTPENARTAADAPEDAGSAVPAGAATSVAAGAPESAAAGSAAVSPLGGPVTDGAGEEDAAQAALAELTGRAVLVQKRSGVFGAYADEDLSQTPLKVSTVVLGTGHGVRREITAFDVHHVAGARLRALYRAAEVYAEHVVPVRQALSGTELEAARGKWRSVDPAALSIASGVGPAAGAVPRWCTATSLLGGETLLVPAAAVRPYGPDNRDRIVEAGSAGTGAGGTAAEATGRAVRTALAHDTLRRALRGTLTVRRLPVGELSGEDAELTFLARSAAGLGVDLEILDLGAAEERALPVVLARAADPATGRWRWTLAAGPRWRDAALDAVRDLLGAVQAEGATGAPLDAGDPLLADLDAGTVQVTDEGAVDMAAATGWAAVAAGLRAAGQDVLAVPVHAPDLAAGRVHATRVLLTTTAARP